RPTLPALSLFSLPVSAPPRYLPSFPTRRSSDLLVVTATHTIGVYLLGLVMLVARASVMPERLFPWISVASGLVVLAVGRRASRGDRKSTRLNSSHVSISYAVFCLKKKKKNKSLV